MSIALTTLMPCSFCKFCSTLPIYKLIFFHLALSGGKSMMNRFAAVFFLTTDRRTELRSLSMGWMGSCSWQSLSFVVNCAESSWFMARCFMLTGVSFPCFNVSCVGPMGPQGAYGASGFIPLVNPKVPSAMSMDSSAVYCTDVHVTGQQLHPGVML